MKYLALASDYDDTLAEHGTVPPATLDALRRFRESGRYLLLVTGREVEDLKTICPDWKLFHWIVGENGAVLYETVSEEETLLGDPPPPEFWQALQRREVDAPYRGQVLLAASIYWEHQIREIIEEHKLPLQIIRNKKAIMVLPSTVDKASGLKACLQRIHVSLENVIGVGDAENDTAFLEICGYRVAVANALPELLQEADFVTKESRGAGIVQLVDKVLTEDPAPVR